MNVPVVPPRVQPISPELDPLMAVLFILMDEMSSIVIHVTAANHTEGVTTVSRQIAAAAAAAGWCKVALIDANADQKLPFVAQASSRPSLVEYFERGENPVLRTARIGAVSLSTGKLSSSGRPGTKLESVRGLYGFMRSNFNLIVVDCPPVLASRQAATLASVADCALLVVEAERTRIADVQRTRETLEQLGASVLGIVLNKRRRRIPRFISRFI
jgi:Mrp family chromosome partitioning ATPase